MRNHMIIVLTLGFALLGFYLTPFGDLGSEYPEGVNAMIGGIIGIASGVIYNKVKESK